MFAKVGVYVDAANLYRNGGSRMRYDVLREFACRDGHDPLRLNAYVVYDEQRGQTDGEYRVKAQAFHSSLRDIGYKVILKEVRWYVDSTGNRYGKADADLDMGVDALLQSRNLDRVVLVTGDGDFVRVVQALQNNGCRVEVVAFDNVSSALKQEADMFMSGYAVPHLLPTGSQNGHWPSWGKVGSVVRGWCYHYDDNKGYGFLRFLTKISPGLWQTDRRRAESPYATAFFHVSKLEEQSITNLLPSRDHIFEFQLTESPSENTDFNAENVRMVV